ncbi:hypothetical protein Hanom_Chr06g00531011 [Helianthus anomalus]
MDTPRVFNPLICWTVASVTVAPKVLLVSPGFANPTKKKSSADMLLLQANPFIFTPVIFTIIDKIKI